MSVAVLTDWAQEPTITYKVVGEASKEATATVPAGFLIEARNEKGNLHPDDGKQKIEVSRHYFSLIHYSFFFFVCGVLATLEIRIFMPNQRLGQIRIVGPGVTYTPAVKEDPSNRGVYKVEYSIPSAGSYELHVLVNGNHVAGSPWAFVVVRVLCLRRDIFYLLHLIFSLVTPGGPSK
jgi:hypothetical protein